MLACSSNGRQRGLPADGTLGRRGHRENRTDRHHPIPRMSDLTAAAPPRRPRAGGGREPGRDVLLLNVVGWGVLVLFIAPQNDDLGEGHPAVAPWRPGWTGVWPGRTAACPSAIVPVEPSTRTARRIPLSTRGRTSATTCPGHCTPRSARSSSHHCATDRRGPKRQRLRAGRSPTCRRRPAGSRHPAEPGPPGRPVPASTATGRRPPHSPARRPAPGDRDTQHLSGTHRTLARSSGCRRFRRRP